MKIIKDEGRVGMLVNSVLRKKAAAFIYGAAKKAEADKKEEAKAEEKAAEAPKAEEKKDDFESMTVKDLKLMPLKKALLWNPKLKKLKSLKPSVRQNPNNRPSRLPIHGNVISGN